MINLIETLLESEEVYSYHAAATVLTRDNTIWNSPIYNSKSTNVSFLFKLRTGSQPRRIDIYPPPGKLLSKRIDISLSPLQAGPFVRLKTIRPEPGVYSFDLPEFQRELPSPLSEHNDHPLPQFLFAKVTLHEPYVQVIRNKFTNYYYSLRYLGIFGTITQLECLAHEIHGVSSVGTDTDVASILQEDDNHWMSAPSDDIDSEDWIIISLKHEHCTLKELQISAFCDGDDAGLPIYPPYILRLSMGSSPDQLFTFFEAKYPHTNIPQRFLINSPKAHGKFLKLTFSKKQQVDKDLKYRVGIQSVTPFGIIEIPQDTHPKTESPDPIPSALPPNTVGTDTDGLEEFITSSLLLETPDRKVVNSKKFLSSGICCPLTGLPFTDPVIALDGFSYERSAFLEWVGKNDLVSPVTGETLEHGGFYSNLALRAFLEETGVIKRT
ncbi:hypothetical protein BLNAU_872 [Blattamonas nauphoetae]|uniref:U-box domain-containing protein n=1 Tax=Blattamonas nauphoetae TaxID=2049346 RepID=A0ABQ9YL00_9EUKA|nr:hypothetical protein BLNAU_872 [Blattamonas nauphoetae]